MTEEEFLTEFSYGFYSLEEIAEILQYEVDDADLIGCARNYLNARERLETALDNIGFEFG